MPMGANFGDVDNDGYPDNKGGKKFVDITASSGTGDCTKGTAWHSRTSTKTCWK